MENKTTGTVPLDETENRSETPQRPGDNGSDSGPGPESAPEEEGGSGPSDSGEKDDFFPEEQGVPTPEVSQASNGASSIPSSAEPIRSALPVLPPGESIAVYHEPSPTAWRGSAMSHAGAALLGAAVALGAVAATVGLSPKQAPSSGSPPANAQIAQVTPNGGGVNGAGINVPTGADGAGINGGTPGVPGGLTPLSGGSPGATTAPVPGMMTTSPNTPTGAVPPAMGGTPGNAPPGVGGPGNVPPGPPVNMIAPPNAGNRSRMVAPRLGGPSLPLGSGSMLPHPNFNLPSLTPPKTGPASGLPTLPPGYMGNLAGRPPLVTSQPLNPNMTKPVAKPAIPAAAKPKGPTPPPLKANPNGRPTPAGTIPPVTTTPSPPAETGNMDQAIASAQKNVESNPKDPVTYLQLEKLYRRKLIQADRVDEMERYRNLADEAREKAKSLLSTDKPSASKPSPPAANTDNKPTDSSESKPSGTTESAPSGTAPDKSSGGDNKSSGANDQKSPG